LACTSATLGPPYKLLSAISLNSPSSVSTAYPYGSPHVELAMAPRAGLDTSQIKDKARKDLLYLLEGVSKAPVSSAAA
jgi:hypothetical protein